MGVVDGSPKSDHRKPRQQPHHQHDRRDRHEKQQPEADVDEHVVAPLRKNSGAGVAFEQREISEVGLPRDVDEIAVAWNPGIDLETIPGGYLSSRRWRTEHLTQVPARFMQILGTGATDEITMTGSAQGCPPITFINHYDSHVGNAFFASPFEKAAILVLDGRAEKQTSLLAVGNGTKVDGNRVTELALKHGMKIEAGGTSLEYVHEDGPAAAAPAKAKESVREPEAPPKPRSPTLSPGMDHGLDASPMDPPSRRKPADDKPATPPRGRGARARPIRPGDGRPCRDRSRHRIAAAPRRLR